MPDSSLTNPPDGASVILHTGGQVLLYKRDGKPKLFPRRWAIFGGGIESDESPQNTVCRELLAELGYALNPTDLELLGKLRVIEPPYRYLVHYYRSTLRHDFWAVLLNLRSTPGLEREGEGIALFSHEEVDQLHLTCQDRLALERHFRGREFGFVD